MDQDAFRKTYREVNERFCAFEKAVLTNQCGCSQAEKFCIAEREGVHCMSDPGQEACLEILDMLREQARFALRGTEETRTLLPHGKAIRVQVGGMRGIQALLENGEASEQINDIYTTLLAAIEEFSSLDALPFDKIMPHIAAYQGRTRSRRRSRD